MDTAEYYAATTADPEGEHLESSLGRNLWAYGSPVLIIIGTVGNLLSAVVMLRQNLRKCTTSLYLLVLAVVDTLVLYTGLLRHWILLWRGRPGHQHCSLSYPLLCALSCYRYRSLDPCMCWNRENGSHLRSLQSEADFHKSF